MEENDRVCSDGVGELLEEFDSEVLGDDSNPLNSLQLAVIEKEKVISQLESQVEEQKQLRWQESRAVEEKAARIKEWVSHKLRDLEEQNEHLREQNKKCETQMELLRARLGVIAKTNNHDKGAHGNHSQAYNQNHNPLHLLHPHQENIISSSDNNSLVSIVDSDSFEKNELLTKGLLYSSGSEISPSQNPSRVRNESSRSMAQLSNQRWSSSDIAHPTSLPIASKEAITKRYSYCIGDGTSKNFEKSQRRTELASNLKSLEGRTFGHDLYKIDADSLEQLDAKKRVDNSSNLEEVDSLIIDSDQIPTKEDSAPRTLPTSLTSGKGKSNSSSDVTAKTEGGNSIYENFAGEDETRQDRFEISENSKQTRKNQQGLLGLTTDCDLEEGQKLKARLDAECQQLAKDLQAAVRELVSCNGTSGAPDSNMNSDFNAEDEPSYSNKPMKRYVADDSTHDYCEVYSLKEGNSVEEGLDKKKDKDVHSEAYGRSAEEPPPLPKHRYPSWEAKLYELAASSGLKLAKENGIKPPDFYNAQFLDGTHFDDDDYLLGVQSSSTASSLTEPFSMNIEETKTPVNPNPLGLTGSLDRHSNRFSGVQDSSGTTNEKINSRKRNNSFGDFNHEKSPNEDLQAGTTNAALMSSFSSLSLSSDDYAIPPDAYLLSEANSLELALDKGIGNRGLEGSISWRRNHSSGKSDEQDEGKNISFSSTKAIEDSVGRISAPFSRLKVNDGRGSIYRGKHSADLSPNVYQHSHTIKAGYLSKHSSSSVKLKTWKRRWFILTSSCHFYYFKNKQEYEKRGYSSAIDVFLNENAKVCRTKDDLNFEIITRHKSYLLSGDSVIEVEDWVKALQAATKRLSSIAKKQMLLDNEEMAHQDPTIQGYIIKVKNGHPKKCYAVLLGRHLLTFKSPPSDLQNITMSHVLVNMREVRVENVESSPSSSDDEESHSKNKQGRKRPKKDNLTIGIYQITKSSGSCKPKSPIYLHLSTPGEKAAWLYQLTIVSGKGFYSSGTQFEEAIRKLMDVNGDFTSNLWKNPILHHSKECITAPLTSVSTEALQNEAVKLFKSLQLFMSVPLDASGIDYHVVLAQNALQLCLDQPELQGELICALIKQTSKMTHYTHDLKLASEPTSNSLQRKIKDKCSKHTFLNAVSQSLFLNEGSANMRAQSKLENIGSSSKNVSSEDDQSTMTYSGSIKKKHPITPTLNNERSYSQHRKLGSKGNSQSQSKSVPSSPLLSSKEEFYTGNKRRRRRRKDAENYDSVRSFVFIQGWQLLSLAVSLFVPKNEVLWFLKIHLAHWSGSLDKDGVNVVRTENEKYAAYCNRSIERTLKNGGRKCKPSRMEVLSIILKNPFHHSLPHSLPVHLCSGAYHVVGFDGSTTVREFTKALCQDINIRQPEENGFALFADDPFDKAVQHDLLLNEKVCDVLSTWETNLRERGLGKFETRRCVTLILKSRVFSKHEFWGGETEKEKLLFAYQICLENVINSKLPINRDLGLELAALMAQIDLGDFNSQRMSGAAAATQVVEKFYPKILLENMCQESFRILVENLIEKWNFLKNTGQSDCVRIYLNCVRAFWQEIHPCLFGGKVVKKLIMNLRESQLLSVAANSTDARKDVCITQTVENNCNLLISEEGITILNGETWKILYEFPYEIIESFGKDEHHNFTIAAIHDGKLLKKDQGLKKTKHKHRNYQYFFHASDLTLVHDEFEEDSGRASSTKVMELIRMVADYMRLRGIHPYITQF